MRWVVCYASKSKILDIMKHRDSIWIAPWPRLCRYLWTLGYIVGVSLTERTDIVAA